jgi:hypothetical protein
VQTRSDLRRKRDAFQRVSVDLHGCMLIDQIQRENEAERVIFSHERSNDAFHHSGFDSYLLSSNKLAVRFNLPALNRCSQEFYFGFIQWNMTSAITYDIQYSWALKHFDSFSLLDVNEKISWEKGQDDMRALPILP